MASVLHVPGALGPVSSISQRVRTVLSLRSASLPHPGDEVPSVDRSLCRRPARSVPDPSGPERLRGRLSAILPLAHPGYRGGHLRPLQITYIL